jgi:hypothetical protein
VLLVYFSLLSHREDRYITDVLVFGAIAFCERFEKLPLLIIAVQSLFLPFSVVDAYSPSPEIFSGIRDGSVVFGMEPSVNVYKDVEFFPWLVPSNPMIFDSADFCIYWKYGIICDPENEQCNSAVYEFERTCRSWNVLADRDDFVVAEKPA